MEYMTNKQLFERHEQLQYEMNEVYVELAKRNLCWQHLAHHGLNAQAVQVYRKRYKVGLKEAFDAVQAFRKEVKE